MSSVMDAAFALDGVLSPGRLEGGRPGDLHHQPGKAVCVGPATWNCALVGWDLQPSSNA